MGFRVVVVAFLAPRVVPVVNDPFPIVVVPSPIADDPSPIVVGLGAGIAGFVQPYRVFVRIEVAPPPWPPTTFASS